MTQEIWKAIAASRYAAGVLWSPALSFDFMARDWASICVPGHIRLNESVGTSGDEVFHDLATVTFEIPHDMADDDTHSGLFVRLTVNATYNTNGGTVDEGEVRFKTDGSTLAVSATEQIDGTPAEKTLWIETAYPAAATPRVISAVIEARRIASNGPTSVDVVRDQTASPNTYIEIRIP